MRWIALKKSGHPELKSPEPILAGPLFPEVRRRLLELLEGLSSEEWELPTTAGKWAVKDVAAHLLGGNIGNLSRRRDQHSLPSGSLAEWKSLVAFINQINASWVEAARRMSSRVLCDLLAHTGAQIDAYYASLDPFAIGGPVNWAGSEAAPVWLDVAREYTEQWHHQQQIRDAAGRPGLYEPRLFNPVLDAFVRALPHTFREVNAPEGTAVQVKIVGAAGGDWTLIRSGQAWLLYVGASADAVATVEIAQEDAWKIFTRGIRGEEALRRAKVSGDQALGKKVLEMVSVIA
jgi:uncharacterized protein (TIGR03083 family)